jgi:sugar lactone lactonase YvrE
MRIQFSLFATSLLACGVLFTAAYAGHGSGGQNQDVRPDGRGDRIRGKTPPKGLAGTVNTGNGINYHNGPVLHTVNVYYIWYGDWNGLDPTGPPILTDFVSNEGGSSYFNINTTYGDTTGLVPNAVAFVGQTTVAGTSTSLTDNDIASIVATGLTQFGGTPDLNGVYFVLTAPGINETSGFLTSYCGWHNHGNFLKGGTNWDIKYSFVGNASGPSLRNCAAQTNVSTSPNGDPGADAMVSVIAHELEETATDPDLNAWYDNSGQENADKCAWNFGTTHTESNGSAYNMTLGARDYLVQQNWVNASGGGCALSYVNPSGDFLVSALPSSLSVVQGGAVSYDVTVTSLADFAGTVNLSASGLPADAVPTFNPPSIVGSGTSTLTITTGSNSQYGNYPITITATSISPSLTLSATVTLVIAPAGFALSVTPATQNVLQGSPTNYIVTSTPVSGFTEDVALTVSGLPADANFSFSQDFIPGGAGSSTLNVTTSSTTPPGTYPLAITGTSTSLTHTLTATLGVYAPVPYPPNLDQGGFTNTGSSVTNPPGTLSISGSTLTFQSTDHTMAINATFKSSSLVQSCSGSGTHVTCVYTFQGSFGGTLTLNGVPQAINGKTTQVSPTATQLGNGSTAFNAAYTPLYFSNTGQLVRSDDLDGTNLTTYGTQGSGTGQFYGAYGIALDSSGRIYVADTYNSRIVRIDDFAGTNWTTFGTYGSGDGQFNNPNAISIDAAGKIYVMDTGNSRLVRIDDMTGTNWTVATTGLGSGIGQFAQYSTAVAFDTFGSIYVADTGNQRIVRMDDLTGTGWTTLTQSPVIGSYIFSFTSPVGVAVDNAGRIYVADASVPTASVVRVDDMSGVNWTKVSLGSGATPHSIAVDLGGMVLVGGGGAQIVDNMMQVVTSGSGLTNGFGPYYVFNATPIPVPAPRPSAISFSPPSLTFSQNVNTTSPPQSITVTNFGGSPINGLSIAASGVFSQTNNCPSVLVAATSCTVAVSFTPSAAGRVTGSLNISDDSYNLGPSQAVILTGTGTAPGASITPSSLSFAAQVAGTTSTAKTITLRSSGTGVLQVTNVVATGPFSQTNNCSGPMAPNASCTIQVSFAPVAVGTASGSVKITDNAGTQTVTLSGSGSAPVTFSPTSLSFGNVVQATNSTRTITLTNRLNTTLTVSSVAVSGVSGPFAVASNTCGAVAAGASCTVGVTFSPTAVGSATGTLTFNDSALTSPQTVSLSGTGIAPVTLSVTSLSFSATVVGNTSAAKTVTLTNNQASTLSITGIAANGPFAVASNTCGTSVLAGKNCTVGVTFSPAAVGSAAGTLTFTDNATPGIQSVSLTGTGSAPVTLSVTSLSFSTTVAGNTSAAKTVTLTNNQASALNFTSIAASGPFAVSSNTCGTSILAGKNCTVGVTFSPTAVGSATGALTFTDSALTSPQTMSLTGTGSAPVTFSASSINFSTVRVGTTSSARTVTLTNRLNSALTISAVSASTGFAVASNSCAASIGAGASCTVGVTFSPTATGPVTGTLTFTDSAVTSQQVVTLSGTGQ